MAGTSTPDGVDLQEHFAQLDIACACFIDQPAPEALDSATAVAHTVADAVSRCGLIVTPSELFGSVPCGLALSSDSVIDVCLTTASSSQRLCRCKQATRCERGAGTGAAYP